MFQIERAVKLLTLCSDIALPVTQLAQRATGNHENTIALMHDLELCRLLQREKFVAHQRGRPRHMVRTSTLGKRFIHEYQYLLNLRLHANDNDIRKAIRQADLAQRLVEQGISPYARFQEINKLARNIARTAKTHKNSE
jgi:predicted transcriptional regulator